MNSGADWLVSEPAAFSPANPRADPPTPLGDWQQQEECVKEQAVDPTLRPLFDMVGSEGDLKSVSSGYFLSDALLLRKWATIVVSGVQVDNVVQVVAPSRFRDVVLSTSHDRVAAFQAEWAQMEHQNHLKGQHHLWPRT
ncbi:hypothetical protein PAMP_013771 [Pampus punctatissimus]